MDGCKVGECYRLEPDRGDEGWDSGWNFLAGDEDEEYCDDSRNFSIYDLNTLCNHDPDMIPLLGMPYGTWLERGEDGRFYEAEDESEDDCADEASEYYSIVSYFMEFHRDDLPEDMVKALFPVDDPSALTLSEMVDYLQLNRFGSFLDNETKGQIVNISHES